jgi:hypothetical protein
MPEKVKEDLAPVVKEKASFSIIESPSSAFMNPQVYMQAKYIANDMIKDHALPKGFESAGQAVMAMQAGAMMGMNWVESLSSLYFVNGSINIWGKAVPNRLRMHGYKFKFIKEDQTHCEARVWKEDDKGKITEEYVEDFKFEDAKSSGYTSGNSGMKVGWKEGINRTKKMRYNVLALIISTYIPDVLSAVAGIVEVSQDYVAIDRKSEMAETISNALQDRKEKKKEQIIIVEDEAETDCIVAADTPEAKIVYKGLGVDSKVNKILGKKGVEDEAENTVVTAND